MPGIRTPWSPKVLLSGIVGLGLLLAAAWLLRPRVVSEVPLAELERRDGVFFLRSGTNQTFNGWVVDRYSGGTLMSRSRVVEGRLHGVSEGWHTNGLPQVREHFSRGIAEGPVIRWHPNGARLSEGIARAGKLEGRFVRWHPDGRVAEEYAMIAGSPDGLARSWHPDGSLKGEVRFSNGVVVARQFWKPGEQMASTSAGSPASVR